MGHWINSLRGLMYFFTWACPFLIFPVMGTWGLFAEATDEPRHFDGWAIEFMTKYDTLGQWALGEFGWRMDPGWASTTLWSVWATMLALSALVLVHRLYNWVGLTREPAHVSVPLPAFARRRG